ncbi:hypothetical protein [Brucella pecoris]|uniref:Uncharacterized protein n=1 Tax=Brucella pecoris TaxID=867683 RepID=A0AB34YM30_9HYPH|nr:hypothetical protein [Brucella pecoris]MBB4092230.1 hypothetical protein [Brucella pecoris]
MSQKTGKGENVARDIDMTRACLFLFVEGVQHWVMAETEKFITFLFNTTQIPRKKRPEGRFSNYQRE